VYFCEGFEFGNNLILLVRPIFCLDTQVSGERGREKLTGGKVWLLEGQARAQATKAHPPSILIGQLPL